jgi:hypothetical protein
MKEHLSHLLENERLLPLSDPLDITILHALLGFSIFNEVMLGRYRLLLPTNAASTELFTHRNPSGIRLCDNGCRDCSPYAPSLLPRGLLAHSMRDARSHRTVRRTGSHVHRPISGERPGARTHTFIQRILQVQSGLLRYVASGD